MTAYRIVKGDGNEVVETFEVSSREEATEKFVQSPVQGLARLERKEGASWVHVDSRNIRTQGYSS